MRHLLLVVLLLSQTPQHAKIIFLRDFSAEHGYFFQSGNDADIYTADTDRSITRRIDKNKTVTELAFTRQRYSFVDGSWRLVFQKPADDAKNYLDLSPCDKMDQIDLSGAYSDTKSLLGESKFKDVTKVKSGVTLVLYTTRMKDEVVFNVGLVEEYSGVSKSIIQRLEVTRDTYCGHRLVPVAAKRDEILLFMYFHEIGGSNVMIVKSYLIKL